MTIQIEVAIEFQLDLLFSCATLPIKPLLLKKTYIQPSTSNSFDDLRNKITEPSFDHEVNDLEEGYVKSLAISTNLTVEPHNTEKHPSILADLEKLVNLRTFSFKAVSDVIQEDFRNLEQCICNPSRHAQMDTLIGRLKYNIKTFSEKIIYTEASVRRLKSLIARTTSTGHPNSFENSISQAELAATSAYSQPWLKEDFLTNLTIALNLSTEKDLENEVIQIINDMNSSTNQLKNLMMTKNPILRSKREIGVKLQEDLNILQTSVHKILQKRHLFEAHQLEKWLQEPKLFQRNTECKHSLVEIVHNAIYLQLLLNEVKEMKEMHSLLNETKSIQHNNHQTAQAVLDKSPFDPYSTDYINLLNQSKNVNDIFIVDFFKNAQEHHGVNETYNLHTKTFEKATMLKKDVDNAFLDNHTMENYEFEADHKHLVQNLTDIERGNQKFSRKVIHHDNAGNNIKQLHYGDPENLLEQFYQMDAQVEELRQLIESIGRTTHQYSQNKDLFEKLKILNKDIIDYKNGIDRKHASIREAEERPVLKSQRGSTQRHISELQASKSTLQEVENKVRIFYNELEVLMKPLLIENSASRKLHPICFKIQHNIQNLLQTISSDRLDRSKYLDERINQHFYTKKEQKKNNIEKELNNANVEITSLDTNHNRNHGHVNQIRNTLENIRKKKLESKYLAGEENDIGTNVEKSLGRLSLAERAIQATEDDKKILGGLRTLEAQIPELEKDVDQLEVLKLSANKWLDHRLAVANDPKNINQIDYFDQNITIDDSQIEKEASEIDLKYENILNTLDQFQHEKPGTTTRNHLNEIAHTSFFKDPVSKDMHTVLTSKQQHLNKLINELRDRINNQRNSLKERKIVAKNANKVYTDWSLSYRLIKDKNAEAMIFSDDNLKRDIINNFNCQDDFLTTALDQINEEQRIIERKVEELHYETYYSTLFNGKNDHPIFVEIQDMAAKIYKHLETKRNIVEIIVSGLQQTLANTNLKLNKLKEKIKIIESSKTSLIRELKAIDSIASEENKRQKLLEIFRKLSELLFHCVKKIWKEKESVKDKRFQLEGEINHYLADDKNNKYLTKLISLTIQHIKPVKEKSKQIKNAFANEDIQLYRKNCENTDETWKFKHEDTIFNPTLSKKEREEQLEKLNEFTTFQEKTSNDGQKCFLDYETLRNDINILKQDIHDCRNPEYKAYQKANKRKDLHPLTAIHTINDIGEKQRVPAMPKKLVQKTQLYDTSHMVNNRTRAV
uniref:Uncharacterized protein n=1 Tax=Ditylenchus dipsaci TaxID=166011 RepID=A0A915E761_9BILA